MLRLYLDEDSIRAGLVRALGREAFDVVTAAEVKNRGRNDAEQLGAATAEGRVFLTANVRDFSRLHTTLVSAGGHHAGIIFLSLQRTPIGVQVGALRSLAESRSAEQMRDRVGFLANWI